jgi:hypothetical protein
MRGRQMIVTTAIPDERCSRSRLRNAVRAYTRGPDRVKRTTAVGKITTGRFWPGTAVPS